MHIFRWCMVYTIVVLYFVDLKQTAHQYKQYFQ